MSKVNKNKIIKEYLDEHNHENVDTEYMYQKAESVALEYERLVQEEPFEKGPETKQFAIYSVKKNAEQTARPKKDFENYNKSAYRQAKSVAQEEVDRFMSEIHIESDDNIVENARNEFDEIEDNIDDTSWNAVKYQIDNRLQNRLREKRVKNKIMEIVREQSNYNYDENEVHVFTDEIIKQVSERKSEFIKNKIIVAMSDTDIQKEEDNIKNKIMIMFNKEKFWKGAGDAIGKNIYSTLSEHGIQLLVIIVTAIVTGGSITGLF